MALQCFSCDVILRTRAQFFGALRGCDSLGVCADGSAAAAARKAFPIAVIALSLPAIFVDGAFELWSGCAVLPAPLPGSDEWVIRL